MGDAVDLDRVNNSAPKDAMVLIFTCDSGRRNNHTRGRGVFFFVENKFLFTKTTIFFVNKSVFWLRMNLEKNVDLGALRF